MLTFGKNIQEKVLDYSNDIKARIQAEFNQSLNFKLTQINFNDIRILCIFKTYNTSQILMASLIQKQIT